MHNHFLSLLTRNGSWSHKTQHHFRSIRPTEKNSSNSNSTVSGDLWGYILGIADRSIKLEDNLETFIKRKKRKHSDHPSPGYTGEHVRVDESPDVDWGTSTKEMYTQRNPQNTPLLTRDLHKSQKMRQRTTNCHPQDSAPSPQPSTHSNSGSLQKAPQDQLCPQSRCWGTHGTSPLHLWLLADSGGGESLSSVAYPRLTPQAPVDSSQPKATHCPA